jgi:molybdopterin converting factor small subunit
MALVAVGGCVALLGPGLLSLSPSNQGSQRQTAAQSQSSTEESANGKTAYTRVKVRYFQMSSVIPGVTQEYFALPSPATYGELSASVTAAHPALTSMMPTMLVLVDGVVPGGNTPLQNGDEVDFIPAMAGG